LNQSTELSPRTFADVGAMQSWCREQHVINRTIGLVPTMGALHEGHLSLVRRAKAECDVCVATIFVNPTQFSPTEDLSRYPRPLDRDLELLAAEGVEAVFLPTEDVMYPDGFGTYVSPPPVAMPLEGESRPEHFRGVATVVMKLVQIVPADRAFFGRKDYQQLRVIEDMVGDLNVAVEVVPCEIVREADGLAMSSRNRYLSADERQRALSISQALDYASEMASNGVDQTKAILAAIEPILDRCDSVDYAVIANTQTLRSVETLSRIAGQDILLIAARTGQTRLIDNRIL
jgi:pantoate--beta-alanine ligase